ncbi:MAG: 3-hydroxyacyl-ACP dehydratase FabZ [Betaproteobacteria bacterium]
MNGISADLTGILLRLPHRYPRLLIDRITEHEHGRLARALKSVTVNEPFFHGHFPGYPVMPGVLVIEALVQLSAVLAHDHGLALDLTGISGARFKRQVSPGDQLSLESQMGPVVDGVGTFAVVAAVDGELAAEAQLLASFIPLAVSAPSAGLVNPAAT